MAGAPVQNLGTMSLLAERTLRREVSSSGGAWLAKADGLLLEAALRVLARVERVFGASGANAEAGGRMGHARPLLLARSCKDVCCLLCRSVVAICVEVLRCYY